MPRVARVWLAAAVVAALCAQQLVVGSSASADSVTVTDWAGLKAAFLAGGAIVLGADIDGSSVSDGHLAVGDGTAVSLDLNGHYLYVYGDDGSGNGNGNSNVAGISVPATPDTALTIGDTSPDGWGTLNAYGYGSAGIGGDVDESGGNVTITGGNIYAYGDSGAGIGSGPVDNGATDVDGGSLTVTGGNVQAGSSGYGAAGIGGGSCANGGDYTQTGGDVYVSGSNYGGAGVGSGAGWCGPSTAGGTVAVSGGTLSVDTGFDSAGIGGGENGSAAAVTVTGGSVTVGNRYNNGTVGIGNGPGYSGPVAGSLDVSSGYVGVTTYNGPGRAIGGLGAAPGIPVHVGATGTLYLYSSDGIGGGAGQDWGSLINEGTLTLEYGSGITVPAGVEIHNSGRINLSGPLSGAGTIDNTGTIVPNYVGYQYGGSVANDGRGDGGLLVTSNNYRLIFATNGGPASAPGDIVAFGPTLDAVGRGLPGSTPPNGYAFKGWYTAPTGGTQVTGSTDLHALAGADGPATAALYAHYNLTQTVAFSSTAPTAAQVDDTYPVTATGGTSGQPVQFSVGAGTTNSACTVTGSTVTFRHVGTCVVAADQNGVANSYDAAPTAYQSINVARAAQTLILSAPPASAKVGDVSYTVTATGGASGQPIVFSRGAATSPSTACTVSGSTVTINHPGTCAVNADQAGTADYTAATRQVQTFSIGKGNQTITYGTPAPTAAARNGTTYTPTATTSASLPVVITVDPATTNGACVINTGVVSFPHGGQCVLAADQAGTSDRNPAPEQLQSFGVAATPQPINYTTDAPTDAVVGGSAYVPAAQGGGSNNPVTFAIDPATTNSACSIDNGTVTLQHAGLCVLAANQAGDIDYAEGVQLQTFTVGKATQTIAFPAFGANAVVDGSESLSATGGTSGNDVTFSVDPAATNNACTVNGNEVTYLHGGLCSIIAHQLGDADHLDAVDVTRSATVGKAAQAITATSTTPVTAGIGGRYTPTATSPGGAVTFSTSGSACSMTGTVVSFDHAGSCTVNFDQSGSSDYTAAPRLTQTFTVSTVTSAVAVTTDVVHPVHGQVAHATATITVTRGTPTGSVQFTVDGTPFGSPVSILGGSATSAALTAADGHALSAAGHAIGANFLPSSTDYASTGNTTSLVVSHASTTSTVGIVGGRLTSSVTAVAPGSGTPTGTVAFTVGGKPFGSANLVDGTATLDKAVPATASHQVAAAYAGDDAFTGSSASTGQSRPAITATVSGSPARAGSGWYGGSVTVRFHCTADGPALATACPAPVTLNHQGAAQSVTRTIVATDGGAKTVVVRGINIDHTGPSVTLGGARKGGVYRGTVPRVRCAGIDRLSGIASCTLTQRSSATPVGRIVHYRVTATDRAGNRRTTTGSYTVLTRYIDGATYRSGRFEIKAGRTYTLVVTGSGSRPVYYNAEVAPHRPTGRGSAFHAAGKGRWTLGITMDERMRSHRYWNAGIKVGKTVRVLRLRVTNAR